MTCLSPQWRDIETATIGHFRDQGFMAPNIQSVLPEVRICGPAFTVQVPADDGTAIVHAIGAASPGDVLVIDRLNDQRHACWGAVLTAAAQAKGIAGVIIDGFVSDIADIHRAAFPVWCKGRSPITTKMHGQGGALQLAVQCGGTTVTPGDTVLADENGVVVMPAQLADSIRAEAAAIQAKEPGIISQLRNGADIMQIYNPPELSGAQDE